MATQKERRPTSGTYSLDGGKYYFLVSATFTTSKIEYTVQLVITNDLKSKHKFSAKSEWSPGSFNVKKKGTYKFFTDEIMDSQTVGKIEFKVDGKAK